MSAIRAWSNGRAGAAAGSPRGGIQSYNPILQFDTSANITAALARYNSIGATWLRTLASPVEMGCNSGSISFTALDALVADAQAAGINVLIDIGQTRTGAGGSIAIQVAPACSRCCLG
jgi:hypothetical protein